MRRSGSRVAAACVAAVAGLSALAPAAAPAAPSSLVECIEGSDFIGNAAASRDNGLSREAFLDRMEGDFVAIRAFPAALRWFVKDVDDENFLRSAAEDVYDRPKAPDRHRAAFFAACISRSAG